MSESERLVAEELCKGFSEKEIAERLYKSFWTIKTQKKAIYKKLGITKDTELLLCMICEKLHIKFSVKEIHIKGLKIFEDNEQCK